MVKFQFLICDMHFRITKTEFITLISVTFFLNSFSNRLFLFNSAKRQVRKRFSQNSTYDFSQIAIFVRVIYPVMLHTISKQQK